MNFLNPLIEIYFGYPKMDQQQVMPFYREVLWLFSKNLDNRLGMFQHRVNIEIEDVYDQQRNFRFGNIFAYQTGLDIEKFKQHDDFSKRKKILELVYSGFISLGNEYGWDKQIIDDAYNKCINENCHFCYHTEFKLNRNKKYKGRIRINLDKRLVTFTSELLDIKSNELKTTELLQTEHGNFDWNRAVREFGWMDSENFGLKLMKGEVWITAEISSNEVSENFKPKKSSTTKLEGFLKQLKESGAAIKSEQQTM